MGADRGGAVVWNPAIYTDKHLRDGGRGRPRGSGWLSDSGVPCKDRAKFTQPGDFHN